MQTFLPSHDFKECARMLDLRRLGKQIIECRQIIKAILDPSYGWQNHPAVNMWRGHGYTLTCYMDRMADEWFERRGKMHGAYENCINEGEYAAACKQQPSHPTWLGSRRLHSSHRANLLRKDPDHYGQFGWTESPAEGYYWPMQKSCMKGQLLVYERP